MRRLGGAVIHMQQNLVEKEVMSELSSVSFLVGSREKFAEVMFASARIPFDDMVLDFLNDLSGKLMGSKAVKRYPDIVALGFWIRKSSVLSLKVRFEQEDGNIHIGRGIAFHIAPSNVPVNYAYSLIAGLLTGNINIVRIPSKDFPQVEMINQAINESLEKYPILKRFIFLVKYGRNQKVNDVFSAMADIRIVWGGDTTIAELRKSPLAPRAGEITFADRYSIAIIDSEKYLSMENKLQLTEGFYNDTYLTDQNACTSPKIVIWTGNKIEEAKKEFWGRLHTFVKAKYSYQPIMGVNKLTSSCLLAMKCDGVKIEPHEDNYLVRVKVTNPDCAMMDIKESCGFFLEYECSHIMELKSLCNHTRCQTIGFLGEKEMLLPLLMSGMKGVDRVVPIGRTMDFDFIWDGYNLYERLTRTIHLNIVRKCGQCRQ